MLHVLVAALSLTPTTCKAGAPTTVVSRRQAMGRFAGAACAFGITAAAHAEMYGDGKAAAGQGVLARELKFAKAGDETEAF